MGPIEILLLALSVVIWFAALWAIMRMLARDEQRAQEASARPDEPQKTTV